MGIQPGASSRPSGDDESERQVPDGPVGMHTPHAGHMHVHGTGCGHEAVPHSGHLDYVHGEHRHYPHEHHYDEH